MKSVSRIIIGILVLAGISTCAVAQERYFNAGIGIADVDGFDDGLVVIGGYGARIPEVSKNFFVEGEVTATLSDPDAPAGDLSYYTFAGYGTYALPVSQAVDLRGRAGLLYYDADVSGSTGGTGFSEDDDGLELSYGIGVTVEVNTQVEVLVDYTQIESDITHLSAGVQYNF